MLGNRYKVVVSLGRQGTRRASVCQPASFNGQRSKNNISRNCSVFDIRQSANTNVDSEYVNSQMQSTQEQFNYPAYNLHITLQAAP